MVVVAGVVEEKGAEVVEMAGGHKAAEAEGHEAAAVGERPRSTAARQAILPRPERALGGARDRDPVPGAEQRELNSGHPDQSLEAASMPDACRAWG